MLTDRVGLAGLWTDANAALAPTGALIQANELELGANGVAGPRRGLPRIALNGRVGTSDARVRQLAMWSGVPVLHYTDVDGFGAPHGYLAYRSGDIVWLNFANLRDLFEPTSGFRVDLAAAGDNLYVTSSHGLKFVDRTGLASSQGDWGSLRAAGLVRPLDVRGAVAGTSGFLPANSAVAYRTVHGFSDANGRVHLGAPSQREVVINAPAISVAIASLVRTGGTTVTGTTVTPHGFYVGQTVTVAPGEANFAAGNKTITAVTPLTFAYTEAGLNVASTAIQTFTPTAANVSVTQPLPSLDVAGGSMIAGYWFTQVYRTATVLGAGNDPGDLMRQVYEQVWTTAQLSAGSFTFTDSVGDGGRSSQLYTNALVEGIANANDPPPKSNALGRFRDHLFFGDVQRKQQLVLKLIAVGAPGGVQIGDTVVLFGDTYTGAAAASATIFEVYTAGTLSQNIERTARSLVTTINNSVVPYQAAYLSGPDDDPGQILIEERSIAAQSLSGHSPVIDAFSDASGATGAPRGNAWAPALPNGYNTSSVARVGSTVTVTTTVNHPFAVNQRVWLGYLPDETPAAAFGTGWKTVATTPTATTFTFTEAGTATTDSSGKYFVSTRRLNEVAADDSAAKGAVEISKQGEHDAVPQQNRWYPGDRNARVLCFEELANQYYVFKEDGVWRLTGSTVNDFDFELAYPSYHLIARDSLRRLGDVLVGLTDRGVTPITPGGMGAPVSGMVDDLIPMRSSDDRTFLATKAWAYANPNDQEYVLYALASAGTAGAPDPTGALIWNGEAGGWTTTTRHPLAAGVVDQATGYLWAAEAGTNYTRRDLRVGNANDGWDETDFHDGSGAITITVVSGNNLTIAADPMINGQTARPGDVVKQGSAYARVVDYDGTLELNSATGFTTGAATLYRGYSTVVQWLRFTGKEKGEHQFQEILLRFGESGFGDPLGSASEDTANTLYGPGFLTFATPAQALNAEFTFVQGLPGYGSIQNPVKPLDVRMAILDGYQRAAWISPYLSIEVALARWQLDGYTLKHRFVSSRVP